MHVAVSEACSALDARGLLRRLRKDHAENTILQVAEALGRPLPEDLKALYRERVEGIADFGAILPRWAPRAEWRDDWPLRELLPAQAVPIFWDGCGSYYGLDLSSEDQSPAVYFFDHEDRYAFPGWAAGSSLGAFLLLLAEQDRAYNEGWPPDWWLTIDPDVDKCPRAPPLWLAG